MAQPKQKDSKKHWYGTKRHLFGWVAFLIMAGVVGLQVVYPMDRALPFAKLGSTQVGGREFNVVAGMLNTEFESAKVTLHVGTEKSVTYPLRDAGAQLNIEQVRSDLTDYPLWQRIIPFSILAKQPVLRDMPVYFAQDKLNDFAVARAKELGVPAQNAGLAIENGQLVATDDKPGLVVDVDQLVAQIQSQRFYSQTDIDAPQTTVEAEKTSDYFAQVRAEAEEVLSQSIVITINDKDYKPSKAVVAEWLELAEADDGSTVTLAVRDDVLNSYLRRLQKDTREESGTTRITVVNGEETNRSNGKPGRQIDIDALSESIESSLLEARSGAFSASFVAIDPTVIINNTYTSSEAGLRSFVSDKVNTNNVRIAIEQLDGERWSAFGKADETTVSASTYKLFVALRVFDDIDSGTLSWSDSMLDTTVSGCFERMVVVSLNTCAETWIGQYGRANINQFIWNKGFSRGTDFNNPVANHTTARDLTSFYKKLYSGSLTSSANRKLLLDSLNNHGYTKGIPAGSQGRVHNKVGFLWDYSNDSAIVYHPEGTYTIAVMTKGMSFYAIADIVREAERIMYP